MATGSMLSPSGYTAGRAAARADRRRRPLPPWAFLTLAGLIGGGLSVLAGEAISSGLVHDMVTGAQTAGAEMGGALNGVSHGEIGMMKRAAAMMARTLA